MKVLVTEELSDRGLELLRRDYEVDVRPELAARGLAGAIGPYDALIVRSQTKVDAAVVEAGRNLRVIARAGVGLDNVDLEAATRAGVMVLNAPQSNVLSAAEHTIAILLAQARRIPQAQAALISGEWDRSRFQGVELHGKTLGIVGLGRVGTMVAQRALAFTMRVLAYDPFVSKEHARTLGVELMPDLGALLVQADFVSLHLPLVPETVGLIGERELALMKPDAVIVNTARGGIVDEAALERALREGRLGGAALDVFAEEPVAEHPLFGLENVVVTPHLGAATREAQDKAGESIAEMVSLALEGEFVPYAINVAAAEVAEQVRPFMPLAERLGRLLRGLTDEAMRRVHVEYRGRLAQRDTGVLTLSVVKGILSGVVDEPVSIVNAPGIAAERGLAVTDTRTAESQGYVSLVLVRAETEAGWVEVGGTLVGPGAERLVRAYDFDIDIAPADHMAFLLYEDGPGVIGRVGSILDEAGINIAAMDVSRKEVGGLALMGLTLDGPIPASLLAEIVEAAGAKQARAVALPPY